ncbi:replication initiation factor domain-containing protein [Vandammella animalimorsus]|uniref:Replication initiation protein n=1 Tax=Vandammella animalimorsus TaxID=2029117 RepID=A0A2A2B0H1_9BURK|nr:replication initiation factor domain-containing protein [Vandammella animalimorsus]PAT43511.1 replication initiation protein [Vandammella animalimorsus]
MARQSPLVLVGNKIKLRLEENRAHAGSLVSVDWLRATFQVKPNHRHIFSPDVPEYKKWLRLNVEQYRVDGRDDFRFLPCHEHHALQARWLAEEACAALGADFHIDYMIKKGQDFYRFRVSIMREGHECGWVGFVANTRSAAQERQNNTLHLNLYGHACTFGAPGWQQRMQRLIEAENATITRVDLALDDFEASADYLPQCKADYEHGLMNVAGQEPKMNMVGCWRSDGKGHSRSLYIGSKEAGKQTNIYEKGHQLFGPESGSTWTRIELRYGNKLRVISPQVLTNPDSFFSGASDWHAQQLRIAKQAQGVSSATAPESIKVTPRLAIQTVKAEVFRNARWLFNVAAPSVLQAFKNSGDEFLQLFMHKEKPGRLKRFSDKEISAVYPSAIHQILGLGLPEPSMAV